MKLRNILIASLALLAFASCTKDDGTDPQVPKDPVDAVFSFQVTSDLTTSLRALNDGKEDGTIEGTDNERFIESLNVYVFNATKKTLAYYKREVAETGTDGKLKSITEVKDILLKVVPNDKGTSDDRFEMVLIANVGDIQVSSSAELQKTVLGNTIEKYTSTTSLPMVSVKKDKDILSFSPIEFTGLKPSTQKDTQGILIKEPNWVASDGSVFSSKDEGLDNIKKITLKRLVARVQVDQINLELDRYQNASFRLVALSLANVRTKVSMNGGEGDYVKGYQSGSYGTISGGNKIIIAGSESNIIPHFCIKWDNASENKDGIIFPNKDSGESFSRYVFPNTGSGAGYYQTGVLITGWFKVNANAIGELRQYWVPLNKNGQYEVLPNTVYQLLITINGEGSKDEDKPELTAGITATITVADWIVKEQIEDDNNNPDQK